MEDMAMVMGGFVAVAADALIYLAALDLSFGM